MTDEIPADPFDEFRCHICGMMTIHDEGCPYDITPNFVAKDDRLSKGGCVVIFKLIPQRGDGIV